MCLIQVEGPLVWYLGISGHKERFDTFSCILLTMKRSNASINNNRDLMSSQSKRNRSTGVSNDKENNVSTDNNHISTFDKETSSKLTQRSKINRFNNTCRENSLTNMSNVQSQPTISFSSSPSLKNKPISINNNDKSRTDTNKTFPAEPVDLELEDCRVNNIHNRASANSRSQPTVTPSTAKKQVSKCLTQIPDRGQSSNLCNAFLNQSTTSTSSSNSISSHIEGTLEYRELKRLYLKEKALAEEWRKDYAILKSQMATLKATSIPRPTADVIEWIRELMDILNSNGMFTGDGRTLDQIGEDLGVDPASLATVLARTPQKSSLKLFRLLYPTISSRAHCRSILSVPDEQLTNIYNYVRTLHRNLSFSMADMRKAIGTSIRSAMCELRRMQQHDQQRSDDLPGDHDLDANETHESNEHMVSDFNADDEFIGEENEDDDQDEYDDEEDEHLLEIDDDDEEEEEEDE
ncbi:hypothetical protein I4U23_022952 [Adineta vaga]|nr:hypothetical protein I4U23_022952 [Adineta vaga]